MTQPEILSRDTVAAALWVVFQKLNMQQDVQLIGEPQFLLKDRWWISSCRVFPADYETFPHREFVQLMVDDFGALYEGHHFRLAGGFDREDRWEVVIYLGDQLRQEQGYSETPLPEPLEQEQGAPSPEKST